MKSLLLLESAHDLIGQGFEEVVKRLRAEMTGRNEAFIAPVCHDWFDRRLKDR